MRIRDAETERVVGSIMDDDLDRNFCVAWLHECGWMYGVGYGEFEVWPDDPEEVEGARREARVALMAYDLDLDFLHEA